MSRDEQVKCEGVDDTQPSPDQPDHIASAVQRFEIVRSEAAGWDLRPFDGQESLSSHTRLEDALKAAALRGKAIKTDFLIVVRPGHTARLHGQHEDLIRPTLVLLGIALLVFAFIAAFAIID